MTAAGGIIPNHGQLDFNDRRRLGLDGDLFATQHGSRIHHGPNDGRVGGAPANVSGQCALYFIDGRVWILVEEPFRSDHPSRRTKAAVGGDVCVTDPLQRV